MAVFQLDGKLRLYCTGVTFCMDTLCCLTFISPEIVGKRLEFARLLGKKISVKLPIAFTEQNKPSC